jgi:hypothetical protein
MVKQTTICELWVCLESSIYLWGSIWYKEEFLSLTKTTNRMHSADTRLGFTSKFVAVYMNKLKLVVSRCSALSNRTP